MHKFQSTLKEYYIMNKEVCSNSGLIPKIKIFYFCISDIPLPNNYLHKIDAAQDKKNIQNMFSNIEWYLAKVMMFRTRGIFCLLHIIFPCFSRNT